MSIFLRRRGALGVGVAVIVVAFLALWLIPPWQVEQQIKDLSEDPGPGGKKAAEGTVTFEDKSTLINEYRRTLAQIMGGFGLLIGVYFTWRTLTNSERSTSVAQEGQITERFTRAVDQLGASYEDGRKRLEIRLGGIYALERIARDSERDHWTIMEILTTYIQENSPKKRTRWEPSTPAIPAADIQAILNVLKRRNIDCATRAEEGQTLNLNGTNLRGADLRGAHLESANIEDAQLEGALLTESYLEGANLLNTPLTSADLRGAHLERTFVRNADMTGTDVRGTDLTEIDGLALWQVDVMKKDSRTKLPEKIPNDVPENLFGG